MGEIDFAAQQRISNSPTNPALFIVTTADTRIVYQPDWFNPFNWTSFLVQYAESRGVNLYQVRAAFNSQTGQVYTDYPQLLANGVSFPINFLQNGVPMVAPTPQDQGPDPTILEP